MKNIRNIRVSWIVPTSARIDNTIISLASLLSHGVAIFGTIDDFRMCLN